MIKRAQGRNRFGMKNFKKRWFRLTNHEFTYHKTKGEVRRLTGALRVPFSAWVFVDGSAGDWGGTEIEFSQWWCGCNDSVNNMTSNNSAGTKTIRNKLVLINDGSFWWRWMEKLWDVNHPEFSQVQIIWRHLLFFLFPAQFLESCCGNLHCRFFFFFLNGG